MRATQLVALVEERYGVEVERATPFYDEPEKAIYRLDVVGGLPLVVRLFRPDRPTERVEGDGEILRFLAEHDLPVKQVVTAVDGRATSCSEGRGVLVTRLMPGGAPVLSADSLEQMGALLGRLHALPAPAPGEEHLARRAGSLPRDDLAPAGQWLASAHTRLPLDRRSEHDVLRGAIDATHDCEDLAFGLTHPDCHPGNMMQTPEGRIVLFDWDGVGPGRGSRRSACCSTAAPCEPRSASRRRRTSRGSSTSCGATPATPRSRHRSRPVWPMPCATGRSW